jgi:hypothetical protein
MANHENIGEWHGKDLVDRDGEKIGKLEDVYRPSFTFHDCRSVTPGGRGFESCR